MSKILLGDFITEVNNKTSENNQYPVLTSSQNGIVSQETYFNKQIASKDNIGYKIIRKGQFTYRAMSDTGRFYINRSIDHEIGIVSPAYPVFEVTSNAFLLPEFLQKYFQTEHFQNAIALKSTGSTRVSLRLSRIQELVIDAPSIIEQKKIAATLDAVSDLIQLRKRQLEELDLLVKARFVEMFSSEKTICKLSDVCALINGDRGKNYPSDSDFVCEGVPFINAGHLSKNRVDFSNMNYITEDKYSQLSQGKIRKYDILYCLRGSLGKHAIIDFEKGAIASSLVIIRAKQNMILPQYLMMVLGIDEVIRQQNVFNNGSSQPNLSAASVKSYIIPLPAISRQRDFVQFIEFISEFESNINQGLEELYMLKNSLMQQHFR